MAVANPILLPSKKAGVVISKFFLLMELIPAFVPTSTWVLLYLVNERIVLSISFLVSLIIKDFLVFLLKIIIPCPFVPIQILFSSIKILFNLLEGNFPLD